MSRQLTAVSATELLSAAWSQDQPLGPWQESGRVRLLDVDPDLAADLRGIEFERARRHLLVPSGRLSAGDQQFALRMAPSIGALVVSGMLIRDARVFGQPSVQLFGSGDVIDGALLASGENDWRILEPLHLAMLGDEFVAGAATWPALTAGLTRRLLATHEHQHVLTTIVGMSRVEDRTLAILAHLASRWGRVTPDGVVLGLPVTHAALGRLIGARRPTVSLALTALRQQGLVHRRPDGSWLLPPGCSEWRATGVPETRQPGLV